MIGTVIGDWRLESSLGRSAFGASWRARHLRNGNEAIVKILTPAVGRDPAIRTRLREVWSILIELDHPYIL